MSDIVTILKHWVEALRTPVIAESSISDIALFNGGCVTEDIEIAAAELTRLRAEVERLMALLKPLADAATEFEWVTEKRLDSEAVFIWAQGGKNAKCITAGDALRARAALAAGGNGE